MLASIVDKSKCEWQPFFVENGEVMHKWIAHSHQVARKLTHESGVVYQIVVLDNSHQVGVGAWA